MEDALVTVPPSVTLREVVEEDLAILFDHQLDPEANRMAAFPARDRDAFMAHWKTSVLGDPHAIVRTVVVDGEVAGNVVSFGQPGQRQVGYWIGREFWGRGIATNAVLAFLEIDRERPLLAHVARGNLGSIRVLEKCGFRRSGEGTSTVRGETAEEFVYTLEP
jgi:RimJ/RimL family protein N-acetyltransferase